VEIAHIKFVNVSVQKSPQTGHLDTGRLKYTGHSWNDNVDNRIPQIVPHQVSRAVDIFNLKRLKSEIIVCIISLTPLVVAIDVCYLLLVRYTLRAAVCI